MSGAFTAIELNKLPMPDVVEQIDFEVILAEMLADLLSRAPELADTLALESEPAHKVLQVAAYRETLLRQRVNEAAKAVMLAYAGGTDLDQLAANYQVERLLLDAGNPDAFPPVPATYEDDNSLRRRVQLSFEGFSTAGPEGAYIFHGLGADADVLDISALSPTPGQVTVTVLSRSGTGAADASLLAAVEATLSDDAVRPLTDQLSVQSASIINYSVVASLTLFPGPDAAVVLNAAQVALNAYIETNHRLGRDVTLSGLYAALHQEGVHNVELVQPVADILAAPHQAPFCTEVDLSIGGIHE
ncbi:baseplate assembly protein [Marinobacterium stanieri]|uniref:Phage-related baseplate assembly protein n=1 Tax=Marinobacterium stanieri TaxID=49186 RepID=A0A1N6Q2X1_9GAMM|nr:baseplate J/gp47 family protein [Marinobacterium stanieri]SIQ10895.1 Phage-related baseplate assembly protein [Marinobacterium stanieri]